MNEQTNERKNERIIELTATRVTRTSALTGSVGERVFAPGLGQLEKGRVRGALLSGETFADDLEVVRRFSHIRFAEKTFFRNLLSYLFVLLHVVRFIHDDDFDDEATERPRR